MQLIVNTPLEIANCQFRDLRENSLITSQATEIHARELQENLHGGPSIVKNVKFGQFNPKKEIHPLYPVKYDVFYPGFDPLNIAKPPTTGGRTGGGRTGGGKKGGKTDPCLLLERTKQIVDGKIV